MLTSSHVSHVPTVFDTNTMSNTDKSSPLNINVKATMAKVASRSSAKFSGLFKSGAKKVKDIDNNAQLKSHHFTPRSHNSMPISNSPSPKKSARLFMPSVISNRIRRGTREYKGMEESVTQFSERTISLHSTTVSISASSDTTLAREESEVGNFKLEEVEFATAEAEVMAPLVNDLALSTLEDGEDAVSIRILVQSPTIPTLPNPNHADPIKSIAEPNGGSLSPPRNLATKKQREEHEPHAARMEEERRREHVCSVIEGELELMESPLQRFQREARAQLEENEVALSAEQDVPMQIRVQSFRQRMEEMREICRTPSPVQGDIPFPQIAMPVIPTLVYSLQVSPPNGEAEDPNESALEKARRRVRERHAAYIQTKQERGNVSSFSGVERAQTPLAQEDKEEATSDLERSEALRKRVARAWEAVEERHSIYESYKAVHFPSSPPMALRRATWDFEVEEAEVEGEEEDAETNESVVEITECAESDGDTTLVQSEASMTSELSSAPSVKSEVTVVEPEITSQRKGPRRKITKALRKLRRGIKSDIARLGSTFKKF
ncbi:hypothetical protein BOTBODRAFT_177876 [Botryobasidium botryosum FD-172 SS1]|uniref:Uncharacterized protein n=1 Tax=Botryobasidium botryosum (strain FD-172 SS1) TaxID=930990 RepID=A0A067MG23_BOTB1|nr:hypothetical protein BOTBODRAFT_177876 [Botryobasidium botryosum FD-172 SS1]